MIHSQSGKDNGDILHATLRNTAVQDTASESSEEDDAGALSRPVVPGQEIHILIDKGQTGLGLSIVGGSDTLLVSQLHDNVLMEA